MKTYIIYFILLAFSLVGCYREDSENVNQDKIYTAYELYYNANEDITYARATFRFSHLLGTKLQLTEPSEIRFNGVLLSFKAGKGIYENAISGFVDYGTFEFTDLEGTLYSNSIELTPVSFPSSWGPLSHGSSSELIWLGDVLGSTETMQLTLTSQVQTESEVFTENDNGAFSMLLSAGNINDLPIGAAIGALERVSTPALMEGTNAGGTLTGRYRALDYAVNITE